MDVVKAVGEKNFSREPRAAERSLSTRLDRRPRRKPPFILMPWTGADVPATDSASAQAKHQTKNRQARRALATSASR
jgi:hypothetical protein